MIITFQAKDVPWELVEAIANKCSLLFCDSRLDLKALVEAHRPTLEVLVVWMWNGYHSTADLIPYMQPAPKNASQHEPLPQQRPRLIVVGFEAKDSPSCEDAIMFFPKYLSVRDEEEEARTCRTVDQALDVLRKVFARDMRGRESIRLQNMTAVICCVENLSGAGVNTSFTRSIARH